ncbi:plasmid partitioning protein RepA [Maritalea porphyrae]|nr:plasmid partitioning protein RepA [Maritalea porphyrae]MCZ4274163.1 plasmid partitioning protein RepA [Maritalea porphyrae]
MGKSHQIGAIDAVDKIVDHAGLLSGQLQVLRQRMYPPEAEKSLRYFMTNEVSKLTSIPESTLRTLSIDGKGPSPARLENNHRAYTLAQINELRRYFAALKPDGDLAMLPSRQPHEHLQVLAATNFKGGSAKTTTTVHLAHYLALQGYRVLTIDMDPQASLSAMFGFQPELDVGQNETIYAAMRYDEQRKPISEVIRKTYFDGLDLVPGNIEVMEFEYETPRVLGTNQKVEGGLFFERLKLAIEEVADDYDIVLLDTPPSLGYLTLGALYSATSMVITIHPAMLDVASMSQFLLMLGDLADVIRNAGATMRNDFMNYLVTRHDPNDQAQTQIVALLRHLFADDVIMPTALQSTAVELAGLGKRSIYEVEAGEIPRNTLKRARESMDDVNRAILDQVHKSWGRT